MSTSAAGLDRRLRPAGLSGVLAKLAPAHTVSSRSRRRLRVFSDWVNTMIKGPQIIELALIDERSATIDAEARRGEPERSRLASDAPAGDASTAS